MPTYEYACKDCGDHLEAVQAFSDEPLTTCPNCGGSLRKVFGAVGIVFKGSGFYKTDNRSGSRAAAGASDHGSSATESSSSPSNDSSASSTAKSESAPTKEPAKATTKESTTSPTSSPAPSST